MGDPVASQPQMKRIGSKTKATFILYNVMLNMEAALSSQHSPNLPCYLYIANGSQSTVYSTTTNSKMATRQLYTLLKHGLSASKVKMSTIDQVPLLSSPLFSSPLFSSPLLSLTRWSTGQPGGRPASPRFNLALPFTFSYSLSL